MSAEYVLNPRTGRRIRVGGPTFRRLTRENNYNLDIFGIYNLPAIAAPIIYEPTAVEIVLTLPDLLVCIFAFLEIKDLLRCKLINNTWCHLVRGILVDKITQGELKIPRQLCYRACESIISYIERKSTEARPLILVSLLTAIESRDIKCELAEKITWSRIAKDSNCVRIAMPYFSHRQYQYYPYYNEDPEILRIFIKNGMNLPAALSCAIKMNVSEDFWNEIKDLASYLFDQDISKYTQKEMSKILDERFLNRDK